MALVLVERDGPIAIVQLNRPEALNALSDELMEELVSKLQELDRDDEVRCIVLGGNERPSPRARTSRSWPDRRRSTSTTSGASSAGTRSGASGRRSSRRSPGTASAGAASWRWPVT
jgi:hypothetical protein